MQLGQSRLNLGRLGLLVAAVLFWTPRPAETYIDGGPATLGGLCVMSSHIMVVKIESFNEQNRVLIYRKVADLKGKYPRDTIKHVFGPSHGAKPEVLKQPQIGKTAIVFSYWYNGAYDGFGGPEAKGGLVRSYTYFDRQMYICYVGNWDGGRCDDLRLIPQKFCGSPARLGAAVTEILAGNEAVIPCFVKDAQERPTVQRLRASAKLLDYNPKRDFVGFGGDDFTRLYGMPGFNYEIPLPNLGAGAQGASVVDLDGTGQAHLSLFGASRVEVLRNFGDSFLESKISGLAGGCRAAVWADYNEDGKPDLLLATPTGLRLHTNLGNGAFRDDTALLPREVGYNAIMAAAWIDYDGDGRPDIVCAPCYQGLRLYRNLGKSQSDMSQAARWFEDISAQVGLGPEGIGSGVKGDTLAVADVNGDGRPDVLYGAGAGMLLLNTPLGFVEKKDCGIAYRSGKAGAVFGDFDNSGALSLFVPQLDGRCKLFKNDGQGRFTDVTAVSGDLAKPLGMATCAAWGDVDGDGHLDLIVGCLRSRNRFLRNRGDGTFEDATEAIGLNRRIFNTQAIAIADLNNDGIPDLVFTNEFQSSVALLGDPTHQRKRTPTVLTLTGKSGVIGSQVRVLAEAGKLMGVREISGGDGRGGQQGPQAHFALAPGNYRIEVRYSSGTTKGHDITVGADALRAVIRQQ